MSSYSAKQRSAAAVREDNEFEVGVSTVDLIVVLRTRLALEMNQRLYVCPEFQLQQKQIFHPCSIYRYILIRLSLLLIDSLTVRCLTMETICKADKDDFVIDEMDRLIPAGVSGRIAKTQIDHCTIVHIKHCMNCK